MNWNTVLGVRRVYVCAHACTDMEFISNTCQRVVCEKVASTKRVLLVKKHFLDGALPGFDWVPIFPVSNMTNHEHAYIRMRNTICLPGMPTCGRIRFDCLVSGRLLHNQRHSSFQCIGRVGYQREPALLL